MDTVQPNPFCYDPFERPAFTPYTPAAELLANLDHSGHFLLSQIHALDGRLTHLCTDWWSGIERDYRSKSRMMGRGGEEWMEEMEQQEGKFEALHREFWTLKEDRTMMISSLEFAYVKKHDTPTSSNAEPPPGYDKRPLHDASDASSKEESTEDIGIGE